MDNFSQEIDETEDIVEVEKEEAAVETELTEEEVVEPVEFKQEDLGKISFEETESVDIDELQKRLKENLDKSQLFDSDTNETRFQENQFFDDDSQEETQSISAQVDESEINVPVVTPTSIDSDVNSKKYVVYVDAENVDFMEGLSINERREIINKILREQNEIIAKMKEEEKRIKFIKHLIVAVLTFVIGFPILFSIVNSAMVVTMSNYRKATENFVKLYKEQGKVKSINSGAVPEVKY